MRPSCGAHAILRWRPCMIRIFTTGNARQFVQSISRLAPVVLFSAAVQKQGGEHHVNEQWPTYWRDLFAEEGYVTLDPLRAGLLHDDSVDWWYRQNILLMVRRTLHAE